MSAPKHTSGPWKVGALSDEVIAANGDAVAAPPEDQDGTPQWRADAHLIAAAPDLLEALDTAALVIHAPHAYLFAACPDCVCAANRAALKKARGE